jgi:hypothetical protein
MQKSQHSSTYQGITADRILNKVRSNLGVFGLQNLLSALASEPANNWDISDQFNLSLCEVRVLKISLDACLRASFSVQNDLRKMLSDSIRHENVAAPIFKLRA